MKITDYKTICNAIAEYALNRKVCKEIGTNIFIDPGIVFYIKYNQDNICGFAGVHKNEIKYMYVLPEYRLQGVFTKIISEILTDHKNIKVTCTIKSLPAYTKVGFTIKKKLTNYYKLKYDESIFTDNSK